MEENKKSSIIIAGKSYPMLINASEEALLKSVEKKIHEAYMSIQTDYGIADKVDVLAMTLIQLLFEQGNQPIADNISSVDPDLTKIIQLIEESLASNTALHS